MKSALYTRGGDTGTTSLVGGTRRPKTDPRIEAYGTVDELNSWLGLVASCVTDADDVADLQWLQCCLFDIGSHLACEGDNSVLGPGVDDNDIIRVERMIDRLDGCLPRLNAFVLPGGTPAAATAQTARAVCRRAERRVLALDALESVDPHILRMINRLSDYLFALGRSLNVRAGVVEPVWHKR